ncbi:MAG: LPS export ABC transporter periplasmic protein LptC [bacterium]|nr:MAG: LPS export ABC transporter periplasmic protein LptC [bacterium]
MGHIWKGCTHRHCITPPLTVVLLLAALFVPASIPASNDLEMTGFAIVQNTAGGKWEIRARRATYENEREVVLFEVSARMTSEGTERVTVVGDRGRYDSGTMVLHLEGNVAVKGQSGSSFLAPSVLWAWARSVLEASGGVMLTRGPFSISGGRARYGVDTGRTMVREDVRTVWTRQGEMP